MYKQNKEFESRNRKTKIELLFIQLKGAVWGGRLFRCLEMHFDFDFVVCNCQLHAFPTECICTEILKGGIYLRVVWVEKLRLLRLFIRMLIKLYLNCIDF